MSQPGTNLIVKIAVPVVLTAAIVVGVKSCSDSKEKTASTQKNTNAALKDLSPDDLKALGVEGDTPQDTLRTIVGNFRRVQDRLDIRRAKHGGLTGATDCASVFWPASANLPEKSFSASSRAHSGKNQHCAGW